MLDEAGYVDSILVGPEVNHVGEQNHVGEEYVEIFLRSESSTVNYVTWHQYYLNGREAKVKDFVNPLIFNWLPAQIKTLGEFIAASGKNVSMWICMYFTLERIGKFSLHNLISCFSTFSSIFKELFP